MLCPLKTIVFFKFFLCSFDILPLYYIVDLWSNFEEKNKSTPGPNCSMSPKLPNTKRRTKVNFFVPNFRSDTISFPVLLSKISGMKLELIGCKIIQCAASYMQVSYLLFVVAKALWGQGFFFKFKIRFLFNWYH